jgi:CRISPR/Cas system CSM-associated protein Csm3 (group 7 of RAMP superfamily)
MTQRQSATLEVAFQGYWHIGSGLGGGPGADALVARTPGGLPYLPGRTLKGLLREAVSQAQVLGWLQCSHEDVLAWFGSSLTTSGGDATGDLEAARFSTRAGSLIIDSARIGQTEEDVTAWETWAAHPDSAARRIRMFPQISSTRIDASGVAKDQTLRTMEVVVPMTLHAPIEGPASALEAISTALPLLRAIGKNRTRGLGRVQLRLEVL